MYFYNYLLKTITAKLHKKDKSKLLIVCFYIISNFSFSQIFIAPYPVLDEQYSSLIKVKTKSIIPSDTFNYKVHDISIFEPFVEYRKYEPDAAINSLRDSSFASKLSENKLNYHIWNNLQEKARDFFGTQIYKELGQFSSQSLIHTCDSISCDTNLIYVKKELDSIIYVAKNLGIEGYIIGDDLYSYLKKFKSSQFVFTDILIYQSSCFATLESYPNQFFKISFFVFDITLRKLIYYETKYQSNAMMTCNKEVKWNNIKRIFILDHITRRYKKYLNTHKTLKK